MTDSISSPSGFKSSEDELFLRWCVEYPITCIRSVGPAERTETPTLLELHGELPDGAFRIERVPHYWIGFAQIVSIQPRRCGLIVVRDSYIHAIAKKDARLVGAEGLPSHEILKCPCCGRLRYSPRHSKD